MDFSSKKNFFVVSLIALSLIFAFFFVNSRIDFLSSLAQYGFGDEQKKLENPPSVIKAVYMTGWSAGSNNYINYLNDIFKTTQVNAVVIDIKDVSGKVLYKTGNQEVREYGNYVKAIPDVKKLIRDLHDRGIYVIARQVVFKDYGLAKARPDLAVYDKSKIPIESSILDKVGTQDKSNPVLWQDKNGMLWVDPASKEVQDYNILIAKEAFAYGFDEINFDYIRFPSDGKLKDIGFPFFDQNTPKNLAIKDFFKKLRESFPSDKISIDLFGLTTVNSDDLGIGQVIEDSFDYFDYVSPMLYPSHYAAGFIGYGNPAEHPYEVVRYSMDKAILRQTLYIGIQTAGIKESEKKLAKIRPWLQDFTLGTIYTAGMVSSQIRAVEDSMGQNFGGFMLWNPLNIYNKEPIILKNYQ